MRRLGVPGGGAVCALNKVARTGFVDKAVFELRREEDELSHKDI